MSASDVTGREETRIRALQQSLPFLLADLCATYLAPSGLVIGFSMSPPTLDGPKDHLVIPVHGTLNITCRYG